MIMYSEKKYENIMISVSSMKQKWRKKENHIGVFLIITNKENESYWRE
jgi:hypothetical protein